MISENIQNATIKAIISKHTQYNEDLIRQTVRITASRWADSGGLKDNFLKFCLKHYESNPTQKLKLFHKILDKIETIYGLSMSLHWANKWSTMMQTGPIEPIDEIFALIDPNDRIEEDLYQSKLSHVILLNFPILTLAEKKELSNSAVDRQRLAQSRLAELCQNLKPSEISVIESSAISQSYQYINHILFELNRIVFIDNTVLVDTLITVDCHWGLRDQIVLHYQAQQGFRKQCLLAKIWERATLEEVPAEYFNNKNTCWDPFANTLHHIGSDRLSNDSTFYTGRYAKLGDLFEAKKAQDDYSPQTPNYISRSFDLEREMSEPQVRQLFTDYLTNPLLPRVANHLKEILNRDLVAFDIVFNQFGLNTHTAVSSHYDDVVARKFPTLSHFNDAIPDILIQLGFSPQLSSKISKQIKVVSCRTGGFSSFPKMRGGDYILATPCDNEKMNFTAFVTAMHELGHCTEGFLSSESTDYYTLGEVPCAAFSEAFAYLFESKSLQILGIEEDTSIEKQNKTLNLFWSAFLNCGIALVDMDCWQWMYKHPGFTAASLKSAVVEISRNIWNCYYKPILGEEDSVILAVYSVMLTNPLYLPEYAMAIFIQAQMEHHLTNKILGQEMPKMCKIGRIPPDEWMIRAIGEPISSAKLMELAEATVK
jgi:hypothetical protein